MTPPCASASTPWAPSSPTSCAPWRRTQASRAVFPVAALSPTAGTRYPDAEALLLPLGDTHAGALLLVADGGAFGRSQRRVLCGRRHPRLRAPARARHGVVRRQRGPGAPHHPRDSHRRRGVTQHGTVPAGSRFADVIRRSRAGYFQRGVRRWHRKASRSRFLSISGRGERTWSTPRARRTTRINRGKKGRQHLPSRWRSRKGDRASSGCTGTRGHRAHRRPLRFSRRGTQLDMRHLWTYRQSTPCCSTSASASGAYLDVNGHRS
jgi:hypothetical protein